jgi:FMN phosphatase YigB (HAD superfamily)
MKHFESLVGDKFEECKRRFDKFYKDTYLKTKSVTKTSPIMIDAVSMLKEKGYNLIVATNPLFPKEAIDHRVNWAGFSVDDFSHITSYEKNHYTKSNTKFYSEVLDTIGRRSDECMMVGNDVRDDMVASKVGIETYLITDHIIADDKAESEYIINHKGKYSDFFEFVKTLPFASQI